MGKRFMLVLGFICICVCADAYKPKWINNTPQELNKTYVFVEIVSMGSTRNNAIIDSWQLLAQDMQVANACEVNVESGLLTETETVADIRGESVKMDEKSQVYVKVSGQSYKLQAVPVDRYWEEQNGMIKLHTLFMVAVVDNPVFDRFDKTTSYGVKPVFMSVVPGLGQWYKGSKIKGIGMFAAEALAIGGVVLCENERSNNISKIKDQPKYAKEYKNKATNWETGRNIFIGVAAGIWIYNLIDAAVAKGARRVIVRRADGGDLSVRPKVLPDGAGVSFAYSF